MGFLVGGEDGAEVVRGVGFFEEKSQNFVRALVYRALKFNNLPSMDFEMASTLVVSMVVHLAVKSV